MNIYSLCGIYSDEVSNISAEKKHKMASNNFEELYYYKKIIKLFAHSQLEFPHDQMKNWFKCVKGEVGLDLSSTPLAKRIGKVKQQVLCIQVPKREKILQKEQDNLFQELNSEMKKLGARQVVLIENANRKATIEKKLTWSRYEGQRVYFDELIYPIMEECAPSTAWSDNLQVRIESLQARIPRKTKKAAASVCDELISEPKAEGPPQEHEETAATASSMANAAVMAGSVKNEASEDDKTASEVIGDDNELALELIIRSSTGPAEPAADERPSASPLDWVENLKYNPEKFDKYLVLFRRTLKANIEHRKKTVEFTFRGPNERLTKFFCDDPHGSQLKKSRAAGWVKSMINGLVRAGFYS